MREDKLLARIAANPKTFGGKPVVRGLRIPVELILSLLAQGASHAEILDDYPDLVEEDILACLAYARAVIGRDSLEPIEVGGGHPGQILRRVDFPPEGAALGDDSPPRRSRRRAPATRWPCPCAPRPSSGIGGGDHGPRQAASGFVADVIVAQPSPPPKTVIRHWQTC